MSVSVMEVHSFIGVCSYYRCSIPKFAEIAKPLNRLTKNDQKSVWNSDTEIKYEALKRDLTESPFLVSPFVQK